MPWQQGMAIDPIAFQGDPVRPEVTAFHHKGTDTKRCGIIDGGFMHRSAIAKYDLVGYVIARPDGGHKIVQIGQTVTEYKGFFGLPVQQVAAVEVDFMDSMTSRH